MYPVGFYDLREAASTGARGVDGVPPDRRGSSWSATPSGCSRRCWPPPTPGSSPPSCARGSSDSLPSVELFDPALDRRGQVHRGGRGRRPERGRRRSSPRRWRHSRCRANRSTRLVRRSSPQVSAVAADIAGVTTTHINHLTPRVLDIDELYRRMTARGVTMTDAIQGPPRWHGPDVLLRQTSFRALAEPRRFRDADGSVTEGSLRVRFGEVEARGVALTPQGPGALRRRHGHARSRDGVGRATSPPPTPSWRRRAWPTTAAATRQTRCLRGLPARLGGGHLPVQPRHRRRRPPASPIETPDYSPTGWRARSATTFTTRTTSTRKQHIMTTMQTSQPTASPPPTSFATGSARHCRRSARDVELGEPGAARRARQHPDHRRRAVHRRRDHRRARPTRPSPTPRRRSRRGGSRPHRCAARWSPGSVSCSIEHKADRRRRWSPSRRARSPPRPSARCRR